MALCNMMLCRGVMSLLSAVVLVEKYDAGFDMPDNGQTDMAGQAILDMQNQEISDIDQLSRKLPSGSDFLIAYATVPGTSLHHNK